MTSTEKTAIAILKSGRSFDEACESTGISFERLWKLWHELQSKS